MMFTSPIIRLTFASYNERPGFGYLTQECSFFSRLIAYLHQLLIKHFINIFLLLAS